MITDREIQIARLKAGLEREWGAREETPEETARYVAKLWIPHPRPLLRIPLWHKEVMYSRRICQRYQRNSQARGWSAGWQVGQQDPTERTRRCRAYRTDRVGPLRGCQGLDRSGGSSPGWQGC